MNRVSIFRVTTITILDETIVNADISTTANIDRTKMNETQEVRGRSGAKISVYNAANDQSMYMIFDGTGCRIINTSGTIRIEPQSTELSVIRPGTNASISIFGSGGVYKTTVRHDNVEGHIETNAGSIVINPGNTVKVEKDLYVRNRKHFRCYDSTNTKWVDIYHNDFNTIIESQSGDIYFRPATSDVYFEKTGISTKLHVLGSGGANEIQITHTNVNGEISTNAGDIKLIPFGDIDASNKTIKGIAALTYQAAKTKHKIIPGCEFAKGASEDSQYDVLTNGYLQSPDPAFPSSYYYKGLSDILPNGATITDIKMYYYQSDAAAIIICRLERSDFVGNTINVGEVADEDKTDGYNNNHVAIAANNVLSTSYQFWLRLNMNCNDSIGELRHVAIDVTYTVTTPE